MIRRTLPQWLEMIQRTRPTVFAVQALEAELAKHEATNEPSESERSEIRVALERLKSAVQTTQPDAQAAGQMTIEYRPNGKGRLYLEVAGREQLEPIESDAPAAATLEDLRVYLFSDGDVFAGLQVDDANTLPERLEPALTALRSLEPELGLPAFDCPEAGLEQVGMADILAWACQHRVEAGR